MSSKSQSARNLNVPNVLMKVPNVLKVPKSSNLNVPNIPNVLKVLIFEDIGDIGHIQI